MTFESWMVPVALTLLWWTLAIFWPVRPDSGGFFDFVGTFFDRAFMCMGAFIATLITWLVWAIATRS